MNCESICLKYINYENTKYLSVIHELKVFVWYTQIKKIWK